MAKRHVSAQRGSQSHPLPENRQTKGTRKAKIHKPRTSARLKALSYRKGSSSRGKQSQAGLPSAAEASQDPAQPGTPNKSPLKRKRGQEPSYHPPPAQDPLPSQWPRPSTCHAVEGQSQETKPHNGTLVPDPVQSWVLNKAWPREYLKPDLQAREELLERDSWLEEMAARPPIPDVQYVERNGFRYPLPLKKAPKSLRRKQSDSSLTESSDQKKRESKSAPYRDPRYTTMLATKGSFLRDFDHDIPQAIMDICQQLLNEDQTVPQDSLFRDDRFHRLCWKIQERNEAIVLQDITRLIVPSAMNLAICGETHLEILMESANEAWKNSIPVEGPRPQPDYAVGFDRSAFTPEQLEKLDPLIGSVFDTSFFVATHLMYFPFLTCEVKCGAAALDIADRQNAHSMTIAVRSVVELYRAVKREKELDREILGFSISHDDRSVRIYGHYPVIDGDKVTSYRHLIRAFSFVEMNGREKWTTYKFTKNVYDIWMRDHLKRICSAIDQLPSSLDFQVSEQYEVQSEVATGLSQEMGSLLSGSDHVDSFRQEADELDPIPQTATPEASVSKGEAQGTAKRTKKPRIAKEQTRTRK